MGGSGVLACILPDMAEKQGSRMSDDRFVELESRLAHQDQMLHELNEVVTDQQAKIMHLEELCRSLIDRVRSLGDGITTGSLDDEKPPHY